MSILLISVQRNLDIIGLKLLHALLMDRGHTSVLLYLPRFDAGNRAALQHLDAFVRETAPKLIGVSLMAIDYEVARAVTHHLKQAFPEAPIVWGGIHPTTAPLMCLEHADYVCVGEGEQAILAMADAAAQGRPLREVGNLCYLEQGQLKQNPLYPLVEDLDTLPVPQQIPPSSYVQLRGRVTPVQNRHLRKYKRYRGGVYKILTSRGCPHACTYCVNNFLRKLYGRWEIRRRSAGHVMAELEAAMVAGPRIEYVDFTDDCFLACDLEYLEGFCREYKARIGKPFIAKGTPKYFTREKMDLAVDAGLVWANLGLQSGSDRVCRQVYRREISAEEFIEAARLIQSYLVAAYYDVIVDNPFETIEESLETVEMLMAIPRPFYVLIFSLTFYNGTELYARAQDECPERLQDAFLKDYRQRERRAVTGLIEVAGLLHGSLMRRLVAMFRRNPNGARTRLAMLAAKVYCQAVLSPLTYFRLIKRTQKGSSWRTLRVLPVYVRDGLTYYVSHFSLFKKERALG